MEPAFVGMTLASALHGVNSDWFMDDEAELLRHIRARGLAIGPTITQLVLRHAKWFPVGSIFFKIKPHWYTTDSTIAGNLQNRNGYLVAYKTNRPMHLFKRGSVDVEFGQHRVHMYDGIFLMKERIAILPDEAGLIRVRFDLSGLKTKKKYVRKSKFKMIRRKKPKVNQLTSLMEGFSLF